MRGPLVNPRTLTQGDGLIPASAGTTLGFLLLLGLPRAHPRECGDHQFRKVLRFGGFGSSPRVRGPLLHYQAQGSCLGLIPASAGTTRGRGFPKMQGGAHPRECGDHLFSTGNLPAEGGSSPRVRGPLGGVDGVSGGEGLIPASAGTTKKTSSSVDGDTAHPRECGDHLDGKNPDAGMVGSSPRVRGPLAENSPRGSDRGLIPASAGTTLSEQLIHYVFNQCTYNC